MRRAILVFFSILTCIPSVGLAAPCRLALVLALDVSSSVDAEEYVLQRDGLAAALLAPEVQEAILADPDVPVALAVYEFSGRYQHQMVVEWTFLDGAAAIYDAAATITAHERSETEFPTSLGYAIGYAASIFGRGPTCWTYKLDVSGDGKNNYGFGPLLAYKHFPLSHVTVNGLVIGGNDDDAALFDYYRAEVAKGPGSFVILADDYTDYQDAMRRKLLREVESFVIGQLGR